MPVATHTDEQAEYELGDRLLASDPDRALTHYAQALSGGCTRPNLFENLSGLLIRNRKYEEAWKVCELGFRYHPDHLPLFGNQAVALAHLGCYDQALACLKRQSAQTPCCQPSHDNLGNVLRALGRLEEAIAVYRQGGIENANLGLAYLLQGDFERGFRLFEKRSSLRSNSLPGLPFWTAQTNPACLLLYRDQGIGDIIQCARYLPLLNRRGITPVLAINPQLARLMGQIGNCQYRLATSPEAASEAAEQCAWFSLPHVFNTTPETIPDQIAFSLEAPLLQHWARRLGPRSLPRVALVWAGNPEHQNDHHRSLALRTLEPVYSQPGIQFLSLQLGEPARQIAQLGLQTRILDLSTEITDYADTAAILAQVDLVITVDTSVAHLAGTQGVPTWTLLPFAPDWRWMLNREDSPWYPSMRLFRQPKPRDWKSVLEDVAACVQGFFANPAEPVAARLVPKLASVLDLHAYNSHLRLHRDPALPYTACNITSEELPTATGADCITLLGVLDLVEPWDGLLAHIRKWNKPLVFSYHPTDTTSAVDRAILGCANHLSLEQLVQALASIGFALVGSEPVSAQEAVFYCQPV